MERDPSVSDATRDDHLARSQSEDIVVEKLEKHDPPRHSSTKRSLARSIAIVATCTAGMLVNVRLSTFLRCLHSLMLW